MTCLFGQNCEFQSTPPARGATVPPLEPLPDLPISIHAPREGGDDFGGGFDDSGIDISIHAPREGGDNHYCTQLNAVIISIHAPREGGDAFASAARFFVQQFQSTPPARGATAKMHSFTCGSLTNK